MKSTVKTAMMVAILLATTASSRIAEAGILLDGSGTSATYDPLTGNFTGPPGTSNLGPISASGSVNLPLTPTLIVNDPAVGQTWFEAPFDGSQTITFMTGDVLSGDFSGVVSWELRSGDPLDAAFDPLPGSLSQGVWSADLIIDPATSTGKFAGATGTLDITAINPPFDWTVIPYDFNWTVQGEIHTVPEPSSLAVFGIGALGLLLSSKRRRTC